MVRTSKFGRVVCTPRVNNKDKLLDKLLMKCKLPRTLSFKWDINLYTQVRCNNSALERIFYMKEPNSTPKKVNIKK